MASCLFKNVLKFSSVIEKFTLHQKIILKFLVFPSANDFSCEVMSSERSVVNS